MNQRPPSTKSAIMNRAQKIPMQWNDCPAEKLAGQRPCLANQRPHRQHRGLIRATPAEIESQQHPCENDLRTGFQSPKTAAHFPLPVQKKTQVSNAPWVGRRVLMYNRAKPPAYQARADNRHVANHYPPEARPRNGPAAAPTPAGVDHAARAAAPPASVYGHGHAHTHGSGTAAAETIAPGPVRSTLLQPRVAVALGVSKKWYPVLFLCRLVSILPDVLFGLPNALRLLATLHLMYLDRVIDGGALSKLGRGGGAGPSSTSGYDLAFEARLRLTEALLATIWVSYPTHPRRAELHTGLLSMMRRRTDSCCSTNAPVLRIRLPLLLLYRLPHVPLAAPLHAASHHRPAPHRRRNKRLPHLLGPAPNRRVRRSSPDPPGLDHHFDGPQPPPPKSPPPLTGRRLIR